MKTIGTCLTVIVLTGRLFGAPLLSETFEKDSLSRWKRIDGKHWRMTDNSLGKAVQHIRYSGAALSSRPSTLRYEHKIPVNNKEKKLWVSAVIQTSDSKHSANGTVALLCFDIQGKVIATLETKPVAAATGRFTEIADILNCPAGTVSICPELRIYYNRTPEKHIYTVFDSLEIFPFSEIKDNYHKQVFNTSPPAPVELESPDSGKRTYGNLSIGKFYRFSRMPDLYMDDINSGHWTNGSKLTDGVRLSGEDFQKNLFCGWSGSERISITIDLGRSQTLTAAFITGFREAEARFRLPAKIQISTRCSPQEPWKFWEKWDNSLQNAINGRFQIRITGKEQKCRYIQISLQPDTTDKLGMLLLDELELSGWIKNTRKYVPVAGAWHGAFTPTYGFKEPLRNNRQEPMAIRIFERLVGKQVSMVLWYQGMSPERKFAEIQSLQRNDLSEDFYGQRFLSLGWLPGKGIRLDDIINGKLDDYFYEYFSDSIDKNKNLGVTSPIWFRPMNEFNSNWVSWGLEPEKFRAAWRRMYNIAEQIGAAEQHIFVWSPNHRSYPDQPWNKMECSWPGDQYVDWVGVSCYPPSIQYVGTEANRYTVERCREINQKYGSYKPMMIAEGGYSDTVDRSEFVRQWFSFNKIYPSFKAMIWENHNTRVIQADTKALEIYRREIQNPYWLSTTRVTYDHKHKE